MKTETVKLPAFLASALVNGDASSLHCNCGATRSDPKHCGGCDFEALEAAIAYCAPGRIVSCKGESYFARTNDLPGDCGLTPGNVLDYVVLYPEGT